VVRKRYRRWRVADRVPGCGAQAGILLWAARWPQGGRKMTRYRGQTQNAKSCADAERLRELHGKAMAVAFWWHKDLRRTSKAALLF